MSYQFKGVLVCLLAILPGIAATVPPAWATHAETAFGEIEARPAPVSRRECVGGVNVGALCKQDSECPGSTCQDRNVFNITVAVRFNATAAQLTTVQTAINNMAASLFDATDGQAQIGQVTIVNNSTGSGGTIWVNTTGGLSADSGHWSTGGRIYAGIGTLANAGAGEGLAHEFVHLVFDARDEYETRAAGCGAVTGSADCPVPGSGENGCLMDVGGLLVGGTELCWGQGNPLDVTDISGGNHDPSNVTEQSRCRSNRSCWDQIGHSWPTTFLVPAGAPDPEANGLTVDPVVYFQPPSTARIVLVLDNSGSMGLESPTRLDRLKSAALDFVNLAATGTELGLVSFSTTAIDLVPIGALGADRSAYTDAINALTPTFLTNIGDGLQHARDMITVAGGVTANTSIVLMTDGVNNRPLPDPAGDLQSKVDTLLMDGIPVYVTCTGDDLGLDSQCAEIAAGTMGTYVDSAQTAMLPDAFTQFHERILGRHLVSSLIGSLEDPIEGLVTRIHTVPIEPGARSATFVVLNSDAGPAGFSVIVQAPDGNTLQALPLPTGQYVRVPAPMPGVWSVIIRPLTGAFAPLFASRAYVDNPAIEVPALSRRAVMKPGEPFVIYAIPTYMEVLSGVQIQGMVTRPDGTTAQIMLVDTGRATDSGDDVADDGIYTATFTDTAQRGAYQFDLVAIAVDAQSAAHHHPAFPPSPIVVPDFRREMHFSATVNDRPLGSGLCVGTAYGEPGATVQVPIILDDGAGVAGFQVDLTYDPTVLTPAGVTLGADTMAAGGWSISSAPVGAGVLRLLASSNPPSGLTPGFKEVALVDFMIAPGVPTGATPFALRNCILSDEAGVSIPCHLCQEPGVVVVRNANSFEVRPIPSPVGVDRFDPLPFAVSAQAFDGLGNLAATYSAVAGIQVPSGNCAGTLVPNTIAFVNGLGGPDTFRVACCMDPLLPMTTELQSVRVSDPAIAVEATSNMYLGVAKGDLDTSNMVDVLDVLRAVRLALNQSVPMPPSRPFQTWAANMLDQACKVDASIDVLDVVRIRNKVLLRPPLCACFTPFVLGALESGTRADAAPVEAMSVPAGGDRTLLSISLVREGRDALVKVKGAVELSGLQLELRGAGSKMTVVSEGLTAGAAGWRVATAGEKRSLRIIAYSDAGGGVNGDGVVLRLKGAAGARLASAVASDVQGREIAVSLVAPR